MMEPNNTLDTDDTINFDCAILNAGRPGRVKCSTQCANCKVVYNAEEQSTGKQERGKETRETSEIFSHPSNRKQSKNPQDVQKPRTKIGLISFWVGYVFGLYRLKR